MNNFETADITIVVAGGGSGASTLVAGIREAVPQANVTELVTVTDDGSITGELVARYGTQPVGDLRRGLSAMVDDPIIAKVMEHRLSGNASPRTVRRIGDLMLSRLDHTGHAYDQDFASAMLRSSEVMAAEQASLRGYTLGHLVLTAAALELGSLRQASYAVGDVIGAKGRVIPISDMHHRLVYMDGPNTIIGQHGIDDLEESEFVDAKNAKIGFTANPNATPENPYLTDVAASQDALTATRMAHAFVTGVGSWPTSVKPVIEAGGMREAVASMDGQVIVVPNLVETPDAKGMDISDYLVGTRAALGRVDSLIYNNDYRTLEKLGLRPVRAVRSSEQLARDFDIDVYARELVRAEQRQPNPNDPNGETRSRVLTHADIVGAIVLKSILSRRQQLAVAV